jgi:hypothetical protein
MPRTDDVQFKFRIRAQLRALLDEAAQANGTSLNAEITRRLESSFDPLQPSREELGQALLHITRFLISYARVQGDFSALAESLPEGSQKTRAQSIVRTMTEAHEALFKALTPLFPGAQS